MAAASLVDTTAHSLAGSVRRAIWERKSKVDEISDAIAQSWCGIPATIGESRLPRVERTLRAERVILFAQ